MKKGVVHLPSTGYIQVKAYTSRAQIPLQNVTVSITDADGSAIALRLTNRSGMLDAPIAIQVPDLSASLSPNTGIIAFAAVNLYAKLENFEEIDVKNLQVFADTVTLQNLELIPLSEFPENWNQAEEFDTPPQNL